jgi:hypothetical protein
MTQNKIPVQPLTRIERENGLVRYVTNRGKYSKEATGIIPNFSNKIE